MEPGILNLFRGYSMILARALFPSFGRAIPRFERIQSHFPRHQQAMQRGENSESACRAHREPEGLRRRRKPSQRVGRVPGFAEPLSLLEREIQAEASESRTSS